MTVIGSADVAFRARVDKFNRNVEQAKRKMSGFRKTVDRSRRTMAAFGRVMLAGAVVAGFNRMRESIDRLGKTSDRLGIAVEQLQALQITAETTGVAARTLDMALQRMVRRIAEAAQGTGEARNALKELDLDARRLVSLPVEEQFRRIADAMNRVENQSHRVRLAMRLFDSEGVALVNTLKLGRKGLDDMRASLEKQGAIIDGKTVDRFEKMNDKLLIMRKRTLAHAASIQADWLPWIDKAADKLAKLSKAANGGAHAMAELFRGAGPRAQRITQESLSQRMLSAIGYSVPTPFGSVPAAEIDARARAVRKRVEAAQRRASTPHPFLNNAISNPMLQAPGGFNPAAAGPRFRNNAITNPLLQAPGGRFNLPPRAMKGLGASFDRMGASLQQRMDIGSRIAEESAAMADRMNVAGVRLGGAFTGFADTLLSKSADLGDAIRSLAQDMARIAFQSAVSQPAGEALGRGAGAILTSIFEGAGSNSAASEAMKGATGALTDLAGLFGPGGG